MIVHPADSTRSADGPDGRAPFAGRTYIVTGAAGGIGSATAAWLAARGASLALFDRSADLLEAATVQCEQYGNEVLALGVNQVQQDSVDEGVAQVADHFGGIDGLFANAGFGQFAPFMSISAKNWHRHVDVNLHGTFYISHAVARHMVERKQGGSIVLNASSGAQVYADQLFSYCATKAAIRMMGIGMASELGIHRIRVNVIMPGVIETPMTSSMLAEEAHREVTLSETPVGRMGAPDDIAALVGFMLSDDSGFITGASIPIDGGQTIHSYPRWFRLDYRDEFNEEWTIPT